MELMKRLFNEEEGQGLTEYALVLGAVVVLVVGALSVLGDGISDLFDDVATKLEDAVS